MKKGFATPRRSEVLTLKSGRGRAPESVSKEVLGTHKDGLESFLNRSPGASEGRDRGKEEEKETEDGKGGGRGRYEHRESLSGDPDFVLPNRGRSREVTDLVHHVVTGSPDP